MAFFFELGGLIDFSERLPSANFGILLIVPPGLLLLATPLQPLRSNNVSTSEEDFTLNTSYSDNSRPNPTQNMDWVKRALELVKHKSTARESSQINVNKQEPLPVGTLGYTYTQATSPNPALGLNPDEQDVWLKFTGLLLDYDTDSQDKALVYAFRLGGQPLGLDTISNSYKTLRQTNRKNRVRMWEAFQRGRTCAIDPRKVPVEQLWDSSLEEVRAVFALTETLEPQESWRFEPTDYGHENIRANYRKNDLRTIVRGLRRWRPWNPVVEEPETTGLSDDIQSSAQEVRSSPNSSEQSKGSASSLQTQSKTARTNASPELMADISRDFNLFLSTFTDKPIAYLTFCALRPWIMQNSQKLGVLIPPIKELSTYPEGTFGREYAEFVQEIGFVPVRFGKRRHQLHDVFHLLLGYDIDPHGEQLLHGWFLGTKLFHFNALILLFWWARAGWQLNTPNLGDAFVLGSGCSIDPDKFPAEKLWKWPISKVRDAFGIDVEYSGNERGRFKYWSTGHEAIDPSKMHSEKQVAQPKQI